VERITRVAAGLKVPLTIWEQGHDYLDVIRSPRFGYGRSANPCIDCRLYMVRHAFLFMQQTDARFVVSGEVVGQRPMSQKRKDLETISHYSGHADLLLRPLSARLLPPTRPERAGWVDRSKLFGFSGRGRRELIKLARSLGITEIPSPSSGCALTDTLFSVKVFDVLRRQPSLSLWDLELLKHGRHFRYDDRVKVVVGRRQRENQLLEHMHRAPNASSSALLIPESFQGPAVLVVGPSDESALQFACGLVWRYSKGDPGETALVRVQRRAVTCLMKAQPHPGAEKARPLGAS